LPALAKREAGFLGEPRDLSRFDGVMRIAAMQKPVKIAFAASLVAVAGVIAWQTLNEREPVYAGKSLTTWLIECSDRYGPYSGPNTNQILQDPAVTAIRAIGTNGLPALLNLARAKDSPLKKRMIALMRKQSLVSTHFRTEEDCHSMACCGFYVLGSIGEDAVPALIDLLKSTNSDLRGTASDCLGNIGPAAKAAVPVLIQFINDTNRIVRVDTTINLGRIHMDAATVVPILIKNLTKSNAILPTTINALGDFGEQAMPAVPALQHFLNDENDYVREAATNALRKIYAKTPVKGGMK